MARLGILAAFVCLAGLTGYLLATRDGATPPRAAPPDRGDSFLLTRVAELERRVEILEERVAESRPPADSGPAAPGTPGTTAASPTASPIPPDWQKQQEIWVRRVAEAQGSTARVAVLRQAVAQLRNQAPATSRALLEEVLHTVDPMSEEGLLARFELGHLARGEGDYARSDEYYRGIEVSVPADSKHAADARFQLAWNRKFTGDPAAAEQLFRSVADAEAADPGTKAAALYAVAKLRGEADDAAGMRQELERLIEEAKRHPGHDGVAYYAGLARKLLESLG